MTEIKFYSTKGIYGCFSNFSNHSFEDEFGNVYKTSEHYFQCKKFEGTEFENKVRECDTAKEAATMGRDKNLPLRSDWEAVKEDIMFNAILLKFTQNDDILETLTTTGDSVIIEDSPTDYYWGCGADGTGKNRLGSLLMELRNELK